MSSCTNNLCPFAAPSKAPSAPVESPPTTEPFASVMPPYLYTPLSEICPDIRICTLLAGRFEDELRITITHESLPGTIDRSGVGHDPRMSLGEVRVTLPKGWSVHQAQDGRYLFEKTSIAGRNDSYTSWFHPDYHVPRESYELPQHEEKCTAKSYEALSYAWGSAEIVAAVFVQLSEIKNGDRRDDVHPGNPFSTEYSIGVTANLAEALRYLRYEDRPRRLWADGICIDQQNIVERGHQVGRMGDIYARASRVVAWLGPSSLAVKRVFPIIEYLSAQTVLLAGGGNRAAPGSTHPKWSEDGANLVLDPRDWVAICDLMDLPWFGRLWVIQEIQSASSQSSSYLQCGHDTVMWKDICGAIELLVDSEMPAGVSERYKAVSRVLVMRMMSPKANFLLLLRYSINFACSDPRDKIYGLLGLVHPRLASLIHPRYDLPVREVFMSAFEAAAESTQRLDMLVVCAYQENNPYDIPSWVPDLTASHLPTFAVKGNVNVSSAFGQYRISGRTLEMTGVQVGTIQVERSQSLNTGAQVVNCLQTAAAREDVDLPYPTGGTIMDALACIFFQYYSWQHLPAIDVRKEELRASFRGLANKQHVSEHDVPIRFRNGLMGMKHIEIEKGLFGISVGAARKG